jgi:citronellyl-CoA synthetase
MPSILEALPYLLRRDNWGGLSAATLIERAARRWSDRPAIKSEEGTISYRELNATANRWAAALSSRGVGRGDVVAVLLENRPQLLICLSALVKLGAIAALINTNLRRGSLARSLDLCEPVAIVLGEELAMAYELGATVSLVGNGLATRRFWTRDRGDREALAGFDDLDQLAAHFPATNVASPRSVRFADPCFYVYTSGTTGLPRAAVMSNARWDRGAAATGMVFLNLDRTDTIYVPLPFYHNVALTLGWAPALARGAAVAMRRRFSAEAFWEDVQRYGATACCYVGEICRYLLNQPVRPGERENSVRKAIGVGLRPELWGVFKQRFSIDEVCEVYGASESSGAFINILNLDRTVGLCLTR